jgi:SAM-dependent methyltransferase
MNRIKTVDDAYALTSTDSVRELYANWAQSYDAGFGDAMGYQLPRAVAQAFVAAGGAGPVLDFGAGTGLVAEHLTRLGAVPIDALDLSAEMLAVARNKGQYRDLIVGDILDPGMQVGMAEYAGIVSAGTFTHGHVGPAGLRPLLTLAGAGAVCVISVNAAHYVSAGFEAEIALLEPVLASSTFMDVRIYDDRADDAHAGDMARLLILKKR